MNNIVCFPIKDGNEKSSDSRDRLKKRRKLLVKQPIFKIYIF